MSDWQPIHHEDYEDQPMPAGSDPAEPGTERPRGSSRNGARSDDSARKQSPVGLMLDLPRDFISAMWGCFEQLTRVATALEENNKLLTRALSDKNRPES